MISVSEAEQIILSYPGAFGVETCALENAYGRILAGEIRADRDMPPFDRVTMDGIAISYKAWTSGQREFPVQGQVAAGQASVALADRLACLEVMTGAIVPPGTDTVIRYEDLEIRDGQARVQEIPLAAGQNIHRQGTDRRAEDILLKAGTRLDPAAIAVCASVGAGTLPVKRLPRVLIVSTGNELVDISETPLPYQIRKSNTYQLDALLRSVGLESTHLHLPDEPGRMHEKLEAALHGVDVMLMSGGVSMGKFDYVPGVLTGLGVEQHFHKVRQRPGKPFWFGSSDHELFVFAFPGNPVSTFLCAVRYFLPWLSFSLSPDRPQVMKARLASTVEFSRPMTWFPIVRLDQAEDGAWEATLAEQNGSGDLASLVLADAFLQLPEAGERFEKGEWYPVFRYR